MDINSIFNLIKNSGIIEMNGDSECIFFNNKARDLLQLGHSSALFEKLKFDKLPLINSEKIMKKILELEEKKTLNLNSVQNSINTDVYDIIIYKLSKEQIYIILNEGVINNIFANLFDELDIGIALIKMEKNNSRLKFIHKSKYFEKKTKDISDDFFIFDGEKSIIIENKCYCLKMIEMKIEHLSNLNLDTNISLLTSSTTGYYMIILIALNMTKILELMNGSENKNWFVNQNQNLIILHNYEMIFTNKIKILLKDSRINEISDLIETKEYIYEIFNDDYINELNYTDLFKLFEDLKKRLELDGIKIRFELDGEFIPHFSTNKRKIEYILREIIFYLKNNYLLETFDLKCSLISKIGKESIIKIQILKSQEEIMNDLLTFVDFKSRKNLRCDFPKNEIRKRMVCDKVNISESNINLLKYFANLIGGELYISKQTKNLYLTFKTQEFTSEFIDFLSTDTFLKDKQISINIKLREIYLFLKSIGVKIVDKDDAKIIIDDKYDETYKDKYFIIIQGQSESFTQRLSSSSISLFGTSKINLLKELETTNKKIIKIKRISTDYWKVIVKIYEYFMNEIGQNKIIRSESEIEIGLSVQNNKKFEDLLTRYFRINKFNVININNFKNDNNNNEMSKIMLIEVSEINEKTLEKIIKMKKRGKYVILIPTNRSIRDDLRHKIGKNIDIILDYPFVEKQFIKAIKLLISELEEKKK